MPWKTPLSAFLRRTFTLALAFITFLATGSWTGFGTAVAENEICDHGGSVVAQGSYVVMNNKWGNRNATLCIAPMGSGFNITQMVGFNDPDHWKKPPVGYPSIFLGCHYRSCSPDRSLPAPLSRITSAPSSVSFAFVANGIYDAAYDIWLYTGADTPPGGPAVEIMIHFTDQGLPPLPVEPVSVGGRDWGLWQTRAWWRGGQTEAIYFAPAPVDSLSLNVLDFVNDFRGRHPEVTNDWYLKMISAGIECWSDCAGAGVNSFSATAQ